MSNPGPELVPAAMMKGFMNDYDHYTEDVLLLQGEIHSDRKPVRYFVAIMTSMTRCLPDLFLGFHDFYVTSCKRRFLRPCIPGHQPPAIDPSHG